MRNAQPIGGVQSGGMDVTTATACARTLISGLRPDDIRIDRLIGYVVGFEVDRTIAATEMLRSTQRGERDLIGQVFGIGFSDENHRAVQK